MSRIAYVVAVLAAACAAFAAHAETRHVAPGGNDTGGCTLPASPCATISYAIGQASAGDTIDIAAGTYTEPAGIGIDEPLVLQGAGREATFIQAHADPGAASGRVATITGAFAVSLADLTIRHGVAGAGLELGGGLYSEDATLSLARVAFRDNTATDSGGGLLAAGGSASLVDVVFEDNHAGVQGGGMASAANAPSLSNVTFRQNSADGYGGGLYSIGGSPSLQDVAFDQNDANWGGGMYALGGAPTLLDTSFDANNAVFGGGLYDNSAPAILTNVAFTGNTALNGAGMRIEGSSPTLTGVSFTSNSASSQGGGLHLDAGSSPLLSMVDFDLNQAERGAGMYNAGGSPQLAGGAFSGNTAGSGLGGGVYNGGGAPAFTNVAFSANTADCGGGMFNTGGATPTLTDVDFVENLAVGGSGGGGGVCSINVAEHGGGGGMFNLGSSPSLSNVAFTGNSTTQSRNGGGMYNVQSTSTLAHVTFTQNSVNGSDLLTSGGGMYNSGGSATLDDVQFIANTSSRSGGGMSNRAGATTTLTNVSFSGNVAGVGASGGGMANQGSATTLANVIFSDNTAGSNGGGLIVGSGGSAALDEVDFLDNEATFEGGGMALDEGTATLANIVFARNAVESSPGGHGGGMHVGPGSTATLVNALFHGNLAGNGGGLDVVTGGSATLINATVWGNTATFSLGGGLINAGGTLELRNSVVWGNSAANAGNELLCFEDGPTSLLYSLYDDQPGDLPDGDCLTTGFSVRGDPLFADAAGGDFHLSNGSPAVNAGDPATDPDLFPDDGNGDPLDLAGDPRFIGPAIDMGAYESTFDTPTHPTLAFAPTALAFGDVGIGVPSLPRPATLRNNGTADATQLAFDVSDTAFSIDTSACGTTLARGASCEVAVVFTPTASGSFDAQLTTASAEGVSAVLDLSGSGILLPPRIETEPGSISVVVPQEESSIQSLQIRNLGQQALEWTIATAEPPAGSPRGTPADCEAAPGLVTHDDGTIELGFPSVAPGITLVDHFVPASYPATLQAACLALMTQETTSIGFEIVVLADDGPGGQPGTELGALAFSADDIPVFTPPPPPGYEPTWARYDLSPLGLSIESGGIYVGVRWTQADESVYIAIDASPPNPPGFAGGYAWGFQPGAWLPIDAIFPNYRALMVRVVAASGGACDASATVGWLDIDPATGSTPGGGSDEVNLHFDAHGLAIGDHETLLCIASNDPTQPAATVPVTLSVVAPVARSVTVLGGDDQVARVNAPFPAPLAVQVRDGSNRPLAGVAVTFTAPAAGASAVLSEAIVITDGEGYAAVDAVANGEAGDYVVSAGVDGVATPAVFDLGNRAATVDVGVLLDAQRDHVQAGQMLDYLVTLTNAGPDAADGATIASTLAPQLDLDFATWLCIGPVASDCTANGVGNLADSGLAIPAGGSVSYLLSAPVRLDAFGTLESGAQAGHPDDQNPGNDEATASSQVVIHRDGFESYADGSGTLVALDRDLARDDALRLAWPGRGTTLVDTVLLARGPNGTARFRVERLNTQPAMHVRLTGRDLAGNEYSTNWLAVAPGTAFDLRMLEATSGDGRRSLTLELPGAKLQLPLEGDIAGLRLWSLDSVQPSEPGAGTDVR